MLASTVGQWVDGLLSMLQSVSALEVASLGVAVVIVWIVVSMAHQSPPTDRREMRRWLDASHEARKRGGG